MHSSPRERGQGLLEYAFIIVLIAIVCILLIALMGTQLSTMYSQIVSAFPVP